MYEELYRIAEEEIPELGAYILDTQLNKLAIPKSRIEKKDVPAITKALTEVALMFGQKKAKRIRKRILEEVLSRKEMIRAQKDEESKMRSLIEMGESALLTGDFQESLRDFEQARRISKKRGYKNEIAIIDNKIARVLARMKERDAALNILKEAENLSRETHTTHMLAETYYSYGSVYWWTGDYDRAIDRFHRALELARKLEDDRLMGYAYMGLANTYSERGDVDRDIEYSEKAILHFTRAKMDAEVAKMYINMGVPYEEIGDFQRAESYYLKGLEKSREIGYVIMEAWALSNLSGLYKSPKDAETAESYAKSALEIFNSVGDELGASIVHLNLGRIYRTMKRYDEAKKEFEKAIKVKEKVDSDFGIADAYQRYGTFLKEIKDEKWKDYLKRAMEIYRKIGNPKREIECSNMLSWNKGP